MPVLEAIETQVIAFSPLLKQYTLEEFWALPDPGGAAHYELIGGMLFMVPPPDPPHEDVDTRLNRSLVLFLAAHGDPGSVYHPQAPIYKDRTYLYPDMMYVSNELRARMGDRRTSADIVFEYLSKSTANYDRTTKADTYLALGVRELWLIDSGNATIEVRYRIEPAAEGMLPRWETHRHGAGEWAESRVLAGWRVSVDELLAGLI
jgi:Uma2 family endonuclease